MSAEARASAWRPRHGAALGLLVLLALAHLLPFRGYLTDDTFIHFQFAKHLMRGEGFAFNAGEPTYGATSPAWVLLISGAGLLVPGSSKTPSDSVTMPPLAWIAKGYGVLFTALAVCLFAAVGRSIVWEPEASLAAAALLACHSWAARWAISGMETPLALALAIAAFLCLARTLFRGRSALPVGVVVGLGFLVRPEFLLLLVVSGAAVAWAGGAERRARRLGEVLLGALLGAGPWLVTAWLWFHRLLPNTSAAKAGAWADPERAITSVRESIRIVLSADGLPVLASVLVLALLRPWEEIGGDRGRRAFWAVLLTWPLLLVGSFAAAGVQVVSRYLVPAAPAVILIGIAAFRLAMRRLPASRRAPALLLFVLLYGAASLYVTLAVSAPHARRHTEGLRASLAEIGLWARRSTGPGTRFAVPDIGAFGYYSDRPVLDLYGLVTPELAPVAVREGYDAMVWNLLYESVGRPSYLIDRNPHPGRLAPPDDPATPYRFLFAREIPDLGITRPQPTAYSVYSIDWEVYDRFHPRVATRTSLRD